MSKGSKERHLEFLKQTIELAHKSPPKPTNFRVGCVIVSEPESDSFHILSTGYTLELPGNTHAEQCALTKLTTNNETSIDDLSAILTPEANVALYTSLEPCGKRLSGNLPCVQRIISTRKSTSKGGIRKVVFGAKEPGTFVQDSQSCQSLTEAGIEWEYIPDLESEILQVAMEGHVKDSSGISENHGQKKEEIRTFETQENNFPHQSSRDAGRELTKRDETMPQNPKKRMMEVPPEPPSSS